MACSRCQKRGQTWEGSAPRCAFEHGVFTTDNWNCATMNELRALAYEAKAIAEPVRDWQPGWAFRDDMAAASFGVLYVPETKRGGGYYICMSWYKQRGKTGRAITMQDDSAPQLLTIEEAEDAIIAVRKLFTRIKNADK